MRSICAIVFLVSSLASTALRAAPTIALTAAELDQYANLRQPKASVDANVAAATQKNFDEAKARLIESLIEAVTIERRQQAIRDNATQSLEILRMLAANRAAIGPSTSPQRTAPTQDEVVIPKQPAVDQQQIDYMISGLRMMNVPQAKIDRAVREMKDGTPMVIAMAEAQGQPPEQIEKLKKDWERMQQMQSQIRAISAARGTTDVMAPLMTHMRAASAEVAREMIAEIESKATTQSGGGGGTGVFEDDPDPVASANLRLVREKASELRIQSVQELSRENPVMKEFTRRVQQRLKNSGAESEIEKNAKAYEQQLKEQMKQFQSGAEQK